MKKPKTPRLVTVSIFTTVTIVFWVFFSLYNILVSKPKVDVSNELLEPIDPTLNLIILDSLDQKVFINEGEVVREIIETPTPTPEEEAVSPTISPEITTEPSPTEGL